MVQGFTLFPSLSRALLIFLFIYMGVCSGKIINATVDNLNSSITYNGHWVNTTGVQFFDNSISFSTTAGENATYSFNGTQIFVFGTTGFTQSVIKGGANARYQIDDLPPFPFHDTAKTAQQKQLLFASPELDNGTHTLTIINDGPEYFLDFMLVTTTDEPPPPAQNATSTTTSSSTSSTETPTSTTSSATPTKTSQVNHDNVVTSPSRAAVAGGVAGAAAVTLIVIAVLVWQMRRNRKGKKLVNTSFTRVPSPTPPSADGTLMEPYVVDPRLIDPRLSEEGSSTWSIEKPRDNTPKMSFLDAVPPDYHTYSIPT